MVAVTLEQYGLLSEDLPSCLTCAAPFVLLPPAPSPSSSSDGSALHTGLYLPTAGGELLLPVFNTGGTADDVTVRWDGEPVQGAEFVRTKGGLRLRVPAGPGAGVHTLSITSARRPRAPGTCKIAYAPPTLLRVPSLKTEGGEIVIMGDNFGADDAAVVVTIDGVPASSVVLKQAHKKISCVAPPGVGIVRLTVTVAGQSSSMEVLHEAPEVQAVDPADIDLTGGVVTLIGRSFGTDPARVQVLLKDFAVEATDVELVEPHGRLRATFPPIPEGALPGDALGLRVIVAGLHSVTPATLVYCPPGGIPASATRPAYMPKRFASAGRGALAVPSPYANLFSTELPTEGGSSSSSSSSGAARGSPGAPSTPGPGPAGYAAAADTPGGGKATLKRQPSVVRVGGTLAGGGPTLSITPPTAWAPDAASCGICTNSFGISRRRHHCRICGGCVCGPCSPHQLQLAPTKPPVRVCTRCNLRVGLLNQVSYKTIYI
jgi:hypothetical protein